MTAPAGKVYFVGAGPGDPELLTIKGKRIIEQADVIIYADSLVNPEICRFARPGAEIHGSSTLALEAIVGLMVDAVNQGKTVARVHTGDPSIYGAIREQIEHLDRQDIIYEIIPGVSSVFAAAASLGIELTAPEVSQTVILTRLEGRTPVPPKENLSSLAAHNSTMVLFLSVSMIDEVVTQLLGGGYGADTPVAVVQRVGWQDERSLRGTVGDIGAKVREAGIQRQALILVGEALRKEGRVRNTGARSRLYDEEFAHGYRRSRKKNDASD